MKTLLLNCDMGESFGAWQMGLDEEVMPHIDCASIACGFHAGDPSVMRRTVSLAVKHGVRIGAHPAYPDPAGVGRRSMNYSPREIEDLLHYQIGALDGICRANPALSGRRYGIRRPPLGVVQVPPDGQPIALLSDRQTIGGYPWCHDNGQV